MQAEVWVRVSTVTSSCRCDCHWCVQVLTAVIRHVNWDIVKCLVIAGPGFVKDDFKKFMEEEAVRRDLRWRPRSSSTHLLLLMAPAAPH